MWFKCSNMVVTEKVGILVKFWTRIWKRLGSNLVPCTGYPHWCCPQSLQVNVGIEPWLGSYRVLLKFLPISDSQSCWHSILYCLRYCQCHDINHKEHDYTSCQTSHQSTNLICSGLYLTEDLNDRKTSSNKRPTFQKLVHSSELKI
jgi:hypothetical protein